MDDDMINIVPNELINLPIKEEFFELIGSDNEFICRVSLEDATGYGLFLPAKLSVENKQASFVLPEQLYIFAPDEEYILKLELILDNQFVVPFISQAKITLLDDIEPEEETGEELSSAELESSNEAYNENDEELDYALSVVAPKPIVENQKTKLEDIIKGLDQEFVKNALWNKAKIEQAPITVKESELAEDVDPQKVALKQKLKVVLKNMLED